MAGSLGDGRYEVPASHIACGKRAVAQINQAIGKIELLSTKNASYQKVTDAIKGHLHNIQERCIDHLLELRRPADKK